MKAYGGVDVYIHIFLGLHISWRGEVSFTFRPLHRWERATVPIGKEDGWAPE
jgi:hypothetical protein